MYLGLANLKSAAKRNVVIDGSYSQSKSYLEIPEFTVSPTGKAGVVVVEGSAVLTTDRIIHVIYNPSLYDAGEVSGPQIYGPGTFQLKVSYRQYDKEFELTDMDWFARVYVEGSIIL